jgi:hypothetical protein
MALKYDLLKNINEIIKNKIDKKIVKKENLSINDL